MRHENDFYLSLLFIMQFNYVEINLPCQGGALGKSTCQGERIGNSMTKAVREEKGKCLKATEKQVETKAENFWQRRVQFPLGDSKNLSRQKQESFGKGECSFLMETQSQK